MNPRGALLLVVLGLVCGSGCNSLRTKGKDWTEAQFVKRVMGSDYGSVEVEVRTAGDRRSLMIELRDSAFRSLPGAKKRAKALEIARVAYALFPSKESLNDVCVSFATGSHVTEESDRFTFELTEVVPSLEGPFAQPPPSSAPPAAPEQEEEPTEPTVTIDASSVSDQQLCIRQGRPTDAIGNDDAAHILAAMRSGLRSLRSVYVHGVEKKEIPKIKSWKFEVRASRQSGLFYEAASSDGSRIRVVQLPGGKTYASGKFLFVSDPVLSEKVGDEWFEVPDALLTVNPSDAHPDGPQGFFGMDIGYKAAIADFAQGAIAWYPDEQAKWLFARKKKAGTPSETKEQTVVDSKHPYFPNCRAVLIKTPTLHLELSASDKPLPLQSAPEPGVISSSYFWGQYNKPMPMAKEPPRATTLALLETRK